MEPLTVLAVGPEGLILTDGSNLYWVDYSDGKKGYRLIGMKVDNITAAFPSASYTTYCGGEVDMRQSDDDPMTEGVMELGDRVAECLSAYFTQQEKSAMKAWETMKNGGS